MPSTHLRPASFVDVLVNTAAMMTAVSVAVLPVVTTVGIARIRCRAGTGVGMTAARPGGRGASAGATAVATAMTTGSRLEADRMARGPGAVRRRRPPVVMGRTVVVLAAATGE